MGGYTVNKLEKLAPKFFNYLYTFSGINNSLLEHPLKNEDLVFLDDLHLKIGEYKILKVSTYGSRGHNAINFFRKERKNHFLNPFVILIGAHVKDKNYSNVNDKLSQVQDNELRVSALCFVRGMILGWPNQSLTIQIAKEM